MDRSAHSQARSQSRTPYIPMPKARGFTAILGKPDYFHHHPYLRGHAEPSSALALWWARLKRPPPDRLAVIPLLDEINSIRSCLGALEASARACRVRPLLIFVINNKESAPEHIRLSNQKTLALLWDAGREQRKLPAPFRGFACHSQSADLLVFDFSTAGYGFPDRQGVGLARKIGADFAFALYQGGYCPAEYAHSTDGDALVPLDYFLFPEKYPGAKKAAAFIYPFRHQSPEQDGPRHRKATELYHRYLLDYSKGLKRAGSPYGFPTVGSAICFSLRHYARVRGFPKKQAGEDFYLLNKLRKQGEVCELASQPIILQGRLSSRVPFGTGQGIARITACLEKGIPWKHYPEEAFLRLASWLTTMNDFCEHCDTRRLAQEYRQACRQKSLPDGNYGFWDILDQLRMQDFVQTLPAKARSARTRKHHLLVWFDALKTLQFVHLHTEKAGPCP